MNARQRLLLRGVRLGPSPKLLSGLAKYAYLAEVLGRYRIGLVLDVGANVGQFGQALRAIGYGGRILSFEPLDEAFRALSRLAARDGRWDVEHAALGDTAQAAELAVMRSNVFSSLHAPASTDRFAQENVVERHQPVTVRRLDTVIDERGLRPLLARALLKCDTQGHDRQVLDGMSYLDEVALVQTELSVVALYEDAPLMAEMLAHLDASGFAPIMLSPINRAADGSAIEFDYLGVNTRLPAARG